jgi:hypothetical protein
MKSDRDLICPNAEICVIYKVWHNLATIENEKIIKRDSSQRYYCYALKEHSSFQNNSNKKIDGKDCALIELLNNSMALLDLSNKASL